MAISGWAFGDIYKNIIEYKYEYIDWCNLLKKSIYIENSIIIGWSIGGFLALDKIRGENNFYIIISAGAKFTTDTNINLIKDMIVNIKEGNVEKVLKQFYRQVVYPNMNNLKILKILIKNSVYSPECLIEGLEYLLAINIPNDKLKQIDAIFLGSNKDIIFDIKNLETIEKKFIFENKSHFVLDYKNEINKFLQQQLKK